MISLDQVHLLEQKVEIAISRITTLNREKAALVERCNKLENQNGELRTQLSAFEQDQGRIEKGILSALDRLANMENTILNAGLDQHIQTPVATDTIPATDSTPTTDSTSTTNTIQATDTVSINKPENNSSNQLPSTDSEQVLSTSDNAEITTDDNPVQESTSTVENNDNSITDPSEQDLFSELTSTEQKQSPTESSNENQFIY